MLIVDVAKDDIILTLNGHVYIVKNVLQCTIQPSVFGCGCHAAAALEAACCCAPS